MKQLSIVAASLIAALALSSPAIHAATDKPVDAAAPATAAPKSGTAKKHSHLEERTGVPQAAPKTSPDKANAAKDTSKHYHPRDAK